MITQVIIRGGIQSIEYECSCCRARMTHYPLNGVCPHCGKD